MRHIRGFTLIEVLVALAILSIALTAIVKATAQHIRDTAYVQHKMIAHFVALDVINSARAGLINLPRENSTIENEATMLNQAWRWQLALHTTPNKSIQEIKVDIFDKSDAHVESLTSYVYAPQN